MSKLLPKIASTFLVVSTGVPCLAQMHGDRFEPINAIGRSLGIGWSDGYHECQSSRIDQLQSMRNGHAAARGQATQLYDTATLPPAMNAHGGLHNKHRLFQCNCPTCMSLYGNPSFAAPVMSAPMEPTPAMRVPGQPIPMQSISPNDSHVMPSMPNDVQSTIPNTFVPLDTPAEVNQLNIVPTQRVPQQQSTDLNFTPELIPARPNIQLPPMPEAQESLLAPSNQPPQSGPAAPAPIPPAPFAPNQVPSNSAPAQEDDDLLLIPEGASMQYRTNRTRAANRFQSTPLNRYMR